MHLHGLDSTSQTAASELGTRSRQLDWLRLGSCTLHRLIKALSWLYRSTCSSVEKTWGAISRCQHLRTWPLWWRLHHGVYWYHQRWKHRPAQWCEAWWPEYATGMISWRSTSYSTVVQSGQVIIMDDNARPHRARVVEEYLQQKNIVHMDWSAWSPDLKTIELVWNMLQMAN